MTSLTSTCRASISYAAFLRLSPSGRTASKYASRVPEETILYGTVRAQLETFLACAEASGRSVPAFVERELRAYLKCGILAHG